MIATHFGLNIVNIGTYHMQSGYGKKWAISVHDRSGNKLKVESEKWNKSEKWKAKKNEAKEEL